MDVWARSPEKGCVKRLFRKGSILQAYGSRKGMPLTRNGEGEEIVLTYMKV